MDKRFTDIFPNITLHNTVTQEPTLISIIEHYYLSHDMGPGISLDCARKYIKGWCEKEKELQTNENCVTITSQVEPRYDDAGDAIHFVLQMVDSLPPLNRPRKSEDFFRLLELTLQIIRGGK